MHDHRDLAVQLIELQSFVNVHCLSRRDVVKDDSFVKAADIEHMFLTHTFTSSNVMISAMRI